MQMKYDTMTKTKKREETVYPVGYINWRTLDTHIGLQQQDPTEPSETKTRNARATGFQTLLVLTESRFFPFKSSIQNQQSPKLHLTADAQKRC